MIINIYSDQSFDKYKFTFCKCDFYIHKVTYMNKYYQYRTNKA